VYLVTDAGMSRYDLSTFIGVVVDAAVNASTFPDLYTEPFFSPDGKWFAFPHFGPDGYELYLIDMSVYTPIRL
jgi:Tol biopolymer transport system component